MNAPIGKIAAVTAAALFSAGLGGCIGSFNPETDASSPVAPRVQALVDSNREYPRWADFPKSVEPLPEPAAIAAQVNTLRATGGALAGEVAAIDWQTTGDPDAFAADVQSRIDATQVAPVTQETQAELEEFARRTRERGRAPPPVDRRQDPR
jgi:hypothetical protein